MTRPGMRAARDHAQQLPSFSSINEAQDALFAGRDRDLAAFLSLVKRSATFEPDFTPDSLKALEAWYLGSLGVLGTMPAGEALERGIAAYFGEVLVRNASFEWFVTEYAFAPGKYEIGVTRDPVCIMLTVPLDLASRPDNARKQSLWREYKRYAA